MICIQQVNGIFKITNDSDFDVMISIRPVKPKRKYIDRCLVRAKTFYVLNEEIDLQKISISFTKPIGQEKCNQT